MKIIRMRNVPCHKKTLVFVSLRLLESNTRPLSLRCWSGKPCYDTGSFKFYCSNDCFSCIVQPFQTTEAYSNIMRLYENIYLVKRELF